MALALMFEDDSVAYLDAVTTYAKSKSSNISSHPVDRSALVTDHVSKDNPVFTISAVVSAGDFQTTRTRASDLLEGSDLHTSLSPSSNLPVTGGTISAPSTLLDYLPGSVQQILGGVDTTNITLNPFRGYTHQIARDRFNRAWENSEIITILDYDYDIGTGRYAAIRVVENCILERFNDTETVDTGDSLSAEFTFRQIRYATVKEVDVEISRAPAVNANPEQQAGLENEGDQTNTEGGPSGPQRLVTETAEGLKLKVTSVFNSLTGREQELVLDEVLRGEN